MMHTRLIYQMIPAPPGKHLAPRRSAAGWSSFDLTPSRKFCRQRRHQVRLKDGRITYGRSLDDRAIEGRAIEGRALLST